MQCSFLVEPGFVALGANYENGLAENLQNKYLNFLKDDVSFMAIDTATREICGVIFSGITTRQEHGLIPKMGFSELCHKYDIYHAKLDYVTQDNFYPSEYFQDFPNSDQCIELFAVGVSENYKRKGIATKLVNYSMKEGKKKGCTGAILTATAKATNGIADKLQFSLYKSIKWCDYRDPKTGKVLYDNEQKLPHPLINSYHKFI